MAYIPVNDKYEELIYDEDSVQNIDIIINGTTINKDYVRSISYKDYVFEGTSFSLGSAIISQYILELSNDIYNDVSEFSEIEFKFRLEIDEDTEEIIPLGKYIVKSKEESSEEFTKFTLVDYMSKFESPFDASELIPCTRYELVNAMCSHYGVELENSSFINGDVLVGVCDNTIAGTKYLSYISERAGGFAKINKRTNKLIIKSFSEVVSHELPSDKIGDYKTNELKTLTKIVYENAIQKFERGTDDGDVIYLTSDSPYSCTQQEIDNIFNALNGLQYQTLELRIWGNPAIDAGDKIIANGIQSFAQMEWNFANGFYGKYKTQLEKFNKASVVNKASPKEKIKRIQAELDEINQEINLVIEDVGEFDKSLTAIEMSLDGINETVSKTTKTVGELADSINYFTVDLSQYTLVIPTNSNKSALSTANYIINFYAYFKGKQVTPIVELDGSNTGITTQIDGSKLTLSVIKDTIINDVSSEFEITFSYTENGATYSTKKKVNITLSMAGADGKDGEDGAQGIPGQQGPPGEDGTSSYFYIRYSAFSDGRDMTATPTETTEYLGVSNTTSPTPPTTPSAYIWSKIKGDQGIQGIQGQQGVAGSNGLNSYLHIKWSEDGEAFSANGGKTVARWQGTYVDNSEVDSNIFDDYNWIDTAIVVSDELNDIRDQTDSIQENLNNNYSTKEEIDSQLNDNKSSIDTLKSQIVELQQTALDFSVSISSIVQNGVNKVITETGFIFDKDGLNISKTGEEMKNLVNNKGIYVSREDEEVLGADNAGVRAENVTVRKYLVIGKNSRMEDYIENQTGVFYIGEGDE